MASVGGTQNAHAERQCSRSTTAPDRRFTGTVESRSVIAAAARARRVAACLQLSGIKDAQN